MNKTTTVLARLRKTTTLRRASTGGLRALVALIVLTCGLVPRPTAAEPTDSDAAWTALPSYRYGQDMAPLLAIDRAVIAAMGNPAARAACAARLASLLETPQTTQAARQYICLQLRQVGTPAEVPVLVRLLSAPETSEMARQALESIPGKESLAALRAGLDTLQGRSLLGVVQSLGARRDQESVPRLESLAESDDPTLASAALWSLGRIGGSRAAAFLVARTDAAGERIPRTLAVPLLRCAESLRTSDPRRAESLFRRLANATYLPGARRAALEGLLRLRGENRDDTLVAWFLTGDAEERRVAAGHLKDLPDERLDALAEQLPSLNVDDRVAVLTMLAARKGSAVAPMVAQLAGSKDETARLAGLRLMGRVGDTSAIPTLVEALLQGGATSEAARASLLRLPRRPVTDALLDLLARRPDGFPQVIETLAQMKAYEAIDPLVAMAESDDPAIYGPALDGLRSIADPDATDVPRLVRLRLRAPRGKRADEVEKTILIVCSKLPPGADRAAPVLAALESTPSAPPVAYLPLLGRLGGAQALKRIDAALKSEDPALHDAGVRALCNWPNAQVADRLLEMTTAATDEAERQRTLRAYIRVVSLPDDRPAAATLAMLQKAMELAQRDEDRRLVLERVAAVRTFEAIEWLATYLERPELAQTACKSLVELAHHRFLRHPNMKRLAPILKRVAEISDDPEVVERARRYRLGL